MEYGKIDTLFERDERFVVDPTKLRRPVFGTINRWDVTEKVDGTNIRVMLSDSGTVTFGGRTDKAQLPTDLLLHLQNTFTPEKMQQAMWIDGPVSAVLYGEGYGAGIQKVGGLYRKDKSFRLFDVLIGGKWWLDWNNTSDVASKLGIKTVPYLGQWTLDHIVDRVRDGFPSLTAWQDSESPDAWSEGIVGRPLEPLFDKRGSRIILKLKTKDFKPGKN